MYHCSVENNNNNNKNIVHVQYSAYGQGALLANDTYQVIVAVVADKRPAAVACAVCPGRVGTGVTHQVPISLREERGCEHTCQ